MILEGIIKTPSGLPVLTDTDIDRIAEECAYEYFPEMFEKPQPIDPGDFIECCLGYELDFLYLSNCKLYLGMACFKNIAIPVFNMEEFKAEFANIDAGTVVIDRGLLRDAEIDGYEGRLRFTEAHEAGHCILHSDFFLTSANQTKVGENNYIQGACQSVLAGKLESDIAEQQADMFASCFLIPLGSLRKLMDQFHAWHWDDKDMIVLVKETYNVSWPTAFYRLKKLGWLNTDSTKFDWDEFSEY